MNVKKTHVERRWKVHDSGEMISLSEQPPLRRHRYFFFLKMSLCNSPIEGV